MSLAYKTKVCMYAALPLVTATSALCGQHLELSVAMQERPCVMVCKHVTEAVARILTFYLFDLIHILPFTTRKSSMAQMFFTILAVLDEQKLGFE